MADERMAKVRAYLKPVQEANPRPDKSIISEFAEFWRALSDEEKTEYAAGVPA